MLKEWVSHCLSLSAMPADFYSGARKIIRGVQLDFTNIDNSLKLKDCGFSINKQRMLERNYLHKESQAAALELWEKRKGQDKYGSVGFTCYNHLVKGGGLRNAWELSSKRTGIPPRPGGTMGGRSRPKNDPHAKAIQKVMRASVMGPCIQAVCITYLNKRSYSLDIFYRTTEIFKKFPADLVFIRDVLLKPFDFEGLELEGMHMYFANVTVHPMYAVTIMPHLPDPIEALQRLKKEDRFFHDWIVKWTGRYICPEHHRGIAKFAQALRVQKDANERLTPKQLASLRKYIRFYHPGHRNAYEEDDEDNN